ncbi:MAG: homoserine O-acetyltransferase [Mycobacterium sp.]
MPLHRGGRLTDAVLVYESWGTPATDGSNIVVVLTGLSTGAHASSSAADPTPGWWEPMIGPERAIDTSRWYVLCFNYLGSCRGSTGPTSTDPGDGRPYAGRFPVISVEDIADAIFLGLRNLGIETINTLVGTSMGGMVALSLLARHPGLARRHVNISGAAHSLPHALALRSTQRSLVRSDPKYNNGFYTEERFPYVGMKNARKVALMWYRSPAEWERRFARNRLDSSCDSTRGGPLTFEVEGYIEHVASRFARTFDANSFLALSHALDQFDLTEHSRSSVETTLSDLVIPDGALVVGTSSDMLFPLHQQRQILHGLRGAGVHTQFHELQSDLGHDAFLVENDRLGTVLSEYLRQ